MNSVTIMLIPDPTYIAARPKIKDHHLTVAYFGPVDDHSFVTLSRLKNTVDSIARFQGPINAVANGVGVFDAGMSGIAVVDLIDGIGTFHVRARIEKAFSPDRMGATLDNVNIDYQHGFTPHITREYLSREDDFYGEITPDMIDNLNFKFVAIGLWYGDNRYEVEL